ncbi:vacuolar proton translocating ATPase 100 kDa subunit-like isoform X2 [Schistocerca gregaria]|uniref:vacuolar proton translocating ATPase 100 kDa subunit-like isoform X2 n=1 Tax=Schistocerca gregaria TaxID=7010 RepID=UPI00211DFDD4|nr:vacuolar proton translocating ATPase 100 kDa subunit-like isoform X2 [Schistocerca gregaria]
MAEPADAVGADVYKHRGGARDGGQSRPAGADRVQGPQLNPKMSAFQRNFFSEVKRIEEMERKLRYFRGQMDVYNRIAEEEGKKKVNILEAPEKLPEYKWEDLELKFDEMERELKEMMGNLELLILRRDELLDCCYALSNEETFFSGERSMVEEARSSENSQTSSEARVPLFSSDREDRGQGVRLGFLVGVMDSKTSMLFERIMFRMTRGNLYMKMAEPLEGKGEKRVAFVVFFQGVALENKVKKICEIFGIRIVMNTQTAGERTKMHEQANRRLEETTMVLCKSMDHCALVMKELMTNLSMWLLIVRREKAIYHTMNMFSYDLGHKCLIAEGWVPLYAMDEVMVALRRARDLSGSTVPSILTPISTYEEPPTHFPTRPFTAAFQNVVDTYGIAHYREINPTVFTIITFPFMFGMMFGDVGHGLLILLFALWLIYKGKEYSKGNTQEFISMAFYGRYMILLMGIFSIYCGLLYNEVFSVPIRWLPTNWKRDSSGAMVPALLSRTYELGVDWSWKNNQNELIFYNSVKMKMAIIIGVVHMLLGLTLKAINNVHFRQWIDLAFECIPQILFLSSMFGYLSALIIVKWLYPFYANELYNKGSGGTVYLPTREDAPFLLNVITYMFLSPGQPPPAQNPAGPLGATWELYRGQATVQLVLLIIMVICIPVMLLCKPLALRYQHSHTYKKLYPESSPEDPDPSDECSTHPIQQPQFDFADELIHQAIETIEFTLSTLANTASYLRLWALSLAHSQLSSVFWNMGLVQLILALLPFPVTFLLWMLFCLMTIGILIVLEGISSFLHSMRLHWVEFQNKFYKGDGHPFVPLSFDALSPSFDEVPSS